MNQQAADALAFANERRFALAETRRHIQAHGFEDGCEIAASILESPSEHEQAFPIGRLMTSIHRFGELALRKALRDAGILSADKRVRELTNRQRDALALALRTRASSYRRGPRGSGA